MKRCRLIDLFLESENRMVDDEITIVERGKKRKGFERS